MTIFGKLAAVVLTVSAMTTSVMAGPAKTIASLDLSKPFATPSPWRFVATQEPPVNDTPSGDMEDGLITLCLSKDDGRTCLPRLDMLLLPPGGDAKSDFVQPHYIGTPTLVHPADGVVLLRLDVSSLYAANGDQLRAMALFGYDRTRDVFVPAYRSVVGHNNNQEIRYVDTGPLRGYVISVEPTQNAPFGYWVTVSQLTGATYRDVLHFRSATRYGDNNQLAVIDAEMPNIQQRLGLWHPGQPLPLPAKGCARPHMAKGALWCS